MEGLVGSLNNQASHRLCLSQVEFHGIASNWFCLLRLSPEAQSPSGDNLACWMFVGLHRQVVLPPLLMF